MIVTLSKEIPAIVTYLEVAAEPSTGDLVKFGSKFRRVIAVATERVETLLIVERFKCRSGMYQKIPAFTAMVYKPFAMSNDGTILGRIYDKDTILPKGTKITGCVKQKLTRIPVGTDVKVIRVGCDSPLIWAKNRTGIVEFIDHPYYGIKLTTSTIVRLHRNQFVTTTQPDTETMFIHIKEA